VKIVGHRRDRPPDWAAVDALQLTLTAMRGTGAVVPRGLYRFSSFEEADEWMIRTMARTHASLASRTSRASAGR